jgi:uncharacterized repeat protein (TIGR03806 family)
VRFALCLAIGVLSAGCRQFSEVTDHRVDPKPPRPLPATGLTFPLDPPSLTALETVRAFPKLSFERPVLVTDAPDGRNELYVLEQPGTIHRFDNRDDVASTEVFLDIRDRVRMQHNEEGLLGLAFAPDFARSGVFYLYYSASNPRRVQISRFHAEGGVADPGSEESLLTVDQPYGNHNGGTILFGPDNMLYAGFGDGGAAGDPEAAGQDLGTLLAKIIRIEVGSSGRYRVPKDNPFYGVQGARPEIWAYGLRNPWRFSFDRQTGVMWAGDVGQDSLEEVDIIVKGGNYGWRHREGTRAFNPEGAPRDPYIDPVVEYGRRLGESITGGYVYRGTHLSAFRGAYFYGDYVTGNVWALTHDGTQTTSNELVARVPALSSFGEDEAGELYAVNLDGRLYRFEPKQERDAAPAFPTKLSQTGVFADTATLAPTAGLRPYDLRWPFWSDGADKQRWLVLPEGGQIEHDPEGAWGFPVGTAVVKHFEIAIDDAKPDVKRRLETRVMVHERRGWAGYTYRWNEAQTDADLVTTLFNEAIEVARGGKSQRIDYYYPAGSDCLRCHTVSHGEILGVRTRQLAGGPDSVLARWAADGLFAKNIGDATRFAAHPRPDDASASVDAKARAYLDVNCAICHHPGGPAPGSMDLRVTTSLADAGMLRVNAEQPVAGAGELRIDPGNHAASSLWLRTTARDQRRMPPLASNVIDEGGAALLEAWIDSL